MEFAAFPTARGGPRSLMRLEKALAGRVRCQIATVAGPDLALENDEIVPVDELRLGDVSQDRFDFGRRLAQDAGRLGGAVVDQPPRDLLAFRTQDAHDFASL